MSCACEHCDCKNKPRSGKAESVWVDTTQLSPYPSLSGDTKADVVVIGGGVTGLTTALALAEAGKKVILVEAATLGQGVTGYTTAHLTSIIDTRFKDLISRLGEAKAKVVTEASTRSIAKVADNVKKYQIDCDFEILPGYLYSEREDEQATLQKETQAAQQLGLQATYVTDIPLPFRTAGGVKFENQAQFHPLKYLQGLAAAFTTQGGTIHEGTKVTDVHETKQGCSVKTDKGDITCTHVVMATHTPITKMLLVQSKLEVFRSYVVGVKLENNQRVHGLFWDTDEPYHYTRSVTTPAGDVVIIGGEDHKTGEKTDAAEHYDTLAEYACERFPVESETHRWSAQVFEPIDMLPYIGRAPLKKHIYIATGYAGNGMTFGTVAGLLIPDLIVKGNHAWEKIFKPSRISLNWASLTRQTKMGWAIFQHLLIDRFGKGEGTELEACDKGEGKILQINGKKIAVYKDEQGTVTKLSPVCTHAGCIVAWNTAEKTWDCPCHGGRYTAQGKVINGPPIKDLAPAD